MTAEFRSPLADKLLASDAAADHGEGIGLYGFLPGSWRMDAVIHRAGGERATAEGEIHAGWILKGRALQDVWDLPGSFYGTTLRVYDPSLGAWHIHWHDTLKQYYPRQIGRAEGRDIVQLGRNDAGEMLRWRFTEIERDAFRWIADVTADEGKSWRLILDVAAHRTTG
jgi:hypothetical protein